MGLRVAVFLVPNDWATDLQGKIVNNLQCDMCNQFKINTLILNINPLPSWTKHQDICTEGPSFTVQLWYDSSFVRLFARAGKRIGKAPSITDTHARLFLPLFFTRSLARVAMRNI